MGVQGKVYHLPLSGKGKNVAKPVGAVDGVGVAKSPAALRVEAEY